MTRLSESFKITVFFQFLFFLIAIHTSQANQYSDLMESGKDALIAKNYKVAEGFFKKALEVQPGNYLAIRDLAKIKIELNKLHEALALLNDLLKLPIAKGRDIHIYLEGDPKPHIAELVDETVMVIDKSTQQKNEELSKFLKGDPNKPVPHYRIYLKETGKMKLLPKSKNRIKYFGIPASTREKITSLKNQVKKKIIASIKVKPKEEMVSIKAGCFLMGSKVGDPDELPVHEVCISPFKLGAYEVRQKNFGWTKNKNT